MAKKKQELTPEERLAAALVPEEEQPYKLPEGWKWVRLLDGAAICMDNKRKPINSRERATRDGDVPYYGATGQVGWIDDYLTDEELILLGEDGAPFLDLYKSKAYIISGKAWVNNHAHILRSFMGHIGNVYLMYYLNTFDYRKYVSGTTRLKLTQGKMRSIPVPYPSYSEQQRIVARIESLFAKLDAAKEKVQSVLDAHEARKAALLHEAIAGNLIGTGEREWKPLSEIVDLIRIGPFGSALHKEDYIHDGIPVVNPQYIVNQEICPDNRKSISESKADSLSAYKMCVNDIIIGRRGEMGRTAPVGEREAGWLCGTGCMLLRLKKEYDANFYSRVIASQQSKQYLETHAVGSTMKNLNEKIIRNLPVPIYSVSEQQEIARILDRLLGREETVRQSAESVLASIDRMKQSILARAFRGEL